ncbi:hypothetical protein BJY00DRAFT_313205 [Aspergillus carlsbadensis]|nr:hypothetical protein BJY00DRAFT_313205 [Aspergillus carlsbadensis]
MGDNARLPPNAGDWGKRAIAKKVDTLSLHSGDLASGSKVEEKQYLLFRVLWRIQKKRSEVWTQLNIGNYEKDAHAFLAGYESWAHYHEGVSFNIDMANVRNSTMTLALEFQRQAAATPDGEVTSDVVFTGTPVAKRTRRQLEAKMKAVQIKEPTTPTPQRLIGSVPEYPNDENEGSTPRPTPSPETPEINTPGPPDIRKILDYQTKDEQIVNTALIAFLTSLTLHSSLNVGWSLDRLQLKARFEDSHFEARTDGYLQDKGPNGKVRALIEVKAATRASKGKVIRMQEAAQMVAWIKHYPEPDTRLNWPGRRFHVSQDRDRIYIIVAEYKKGYLDFLAGNEEQTAFMTMHEYGPWITGIKQQMAELAPILVAIALRAAEDRTL